MTIETIEKSDGENFNTRELKQVFASLNTIMLQATLIMNTPQNIPKTGEPESQVGLCYTWCSKDRKINAQLIHTVPASKCIQIASNDDVIIEKIKATFAHSTFKIH